MIVTIDGPAGAGKSSIARQAARELGFEFLDTGALYRAMTFGVLRSGIDLSDVPELIRYVRRADLTWKGHRIYLDGQDVTAFIRSDQVNAAIRSIADVPEIRDHLSQKQRQIAEGRDIVTEGRDQGAEVFPHARCKIFLTASPEERARRRQRQLADEGQPVPLEDVLAAQNRRDLEDRLRPVGRLRAAADATVLATDGMTPEQVLERVLKIVRGARQAVDAGQRRRSTNNASVSSPSSERGPSMS